jgi:mono/diheme cytochrome c family protein
MKIVIRIFAAIALLIVGLVIFVLATWDKKHETPYPEIKASTDSVLIARGKFLAFGPAHCATCHIPLEQLADLQSGKEMPLIGGLEFDIAPGKYRAPNLTPDKETGIGNFTDGELARALRYSVKHDGSLLFPFMPFQELSDEDLTAVISFLRSQQPVKHLVQPTEYKFLGKALVTFGLLKPEGPKNTPPKSVRIDTSLTYGSYIANSVANCVGCHTERDMKTGEFIGKPFAGGLKFAPDDLSFGYSFITPNLTPDEETGIMANWNEKAFVNRMKGGRVHKGSHMPWESFAKMDTVEIKAIHMYLRSLKPVKNKIAKIVFEPGEALPE